MPTGKEIKAYVKARYGFVPDDCWLAHAKAAKRAGAFDETIDISTPKKRCSPEKRLAIFEALRALAPHER